MMLNTGTILERRYRIENVIKQGGMGTVYGAYDIRLDRPCAVKMIPVASASEAAQYQREARTLARLCHPHLPAIYDCLEDASTIYVIMQMIPGDDLEVFTLRNGPPDWDVLLGWALQLAEVVQYLHGQQPPVIHRDIKPANIRLAPHGQIYLVDFGIAKELDGSTTATAARAASVPYAPLEQLQEGSHTNQQSDIYAFGSTLYRLITATLPPSCIDRLIGKDLTAITTLNPTVPQSLELVIMQCMELWSDHRPATMASVIASLEAARSAALSSAPAPHTLGVEFKAVAATPKEVRPTESAPDSQAEFREGQQAMADGDPQEAKLHFTRAVELAPGFADAFAARATANEQLGSHHAAVGDWDRALTLLPSRPNWYVQRGKAQRKRGDTASALSDLSRAIDLRPRHVDAYVERASLRRETGDWAGHLQDLDTVLEREPGHFAARIARTQARLEYRSWQAAVQDCNILINLAPQDPTGYLLRARAYAELGDMHWALRDLQSAIDVDPNSAEAYFLRGRTLQRWGDRQAALQDFNRSLALDPDSIIARRRRGQLLRSLGSLHDALDDYRVACRLLRERDPAASTPRAAEARRRPITYDIEYIMQTSGIERARKHIEAHRQAFLEDDANDLEERAALYERIGDLERALDDLERATKLRMSRQRGSNLPLS
jgi:serine/threonine protein kinase